MLTDGVSPEGYTVNEEGARMVNGVVLTQPATPVYAPENTYNAQGVSNIALEMVENTRACLKIHSWHLHAPLRGIFVPNSLNVAHYAAFIWHKSPTKWHAQLPESNFQTRSSTTANF